MTNTEMKIVCFGDSLTYGYGVLEHIDYPYRLAKDLPEKYPQYSWEIRNSGINGHTTREALIRLRGSVLQHKPQMVFILFGSNDSALKDNTVHLMNMSKICERFLQKFLLFPPEILFTTVHLW